MNETELANCLRRGDEVTTFLDTTIVVGSVHADGDRPGKWWIEPMGADEFEWWLPVENVAKVNGHDVTLIDWRGDWQVFDVREKEDYFLHELVWEIETNLEHPLFGKELRIVGWIPWRDDFILRVPQNNRYCYVHLTGHKEVTPDFPYCKLLETIEEVNDFVVQWSEE